MPALGNARALPFFAFRNPGGSVSPLALKDRAGALINDRAAATIYTRT